MGRNLGTGQGVGQNASVRTRKIPIPDRQIKPRAMHIAGPPNYIMGL